MPGWREIRGGPGQTEPALDKKNSSSTANPHHDGWEKRRKTDRNEMDRVLLSSYFREKKWAQEKRGGFGIGFKESSECLEGTMKELIAYIIQKTGPHISTGSWCPLPGFQSEYRDAQMLHNDL